MCAATALVLLLDIPAFTCAADWIEFKQPAQTHDTKLRAFPVYTGRTSVIDGRTLVFPQFGVKVQLADIDVCELPQWAINPKWDDRQIDKAPMPIPCGSLSKAWLKRVTGASTVKCVVSAYTVNGEPVARCSVEGHDLAVEMLKVGWARVNSAVADAQYLAEEQQAMAARSGMWATFVLDMDEWRKRANDKTLKRQPIADYNLLLSRRSEISPPFEDLRHKPKRTDR